MPVRGEISSTRVCWVLAVSLNLAGTTSAQAELTASLDAAQVTLEQSVNLTIVSTAADGAPDIAKLEQDFEILGSSSFAQTQSINGRVEQNRTWLLQLLPRHTGALVIPSFDVAGERSAPVNLTVTAPTEPGPGEAIGDFHLEAEVDSTMAYVQSQVIYTIRIYHVKPLLEGSLSTPQTSDVSVTPLGKDRVYRDVRNGRSYRVTERRLALFPQKSGTLVLPPVQLNASVYADSSSNQGFFAPRQQLRLRGQSITLEVLPRPAETGSGWWLPASEVTLTGRWEQSIDNVRLGDSLTRSITLSANGVDSNQLPEIPVPDATAARIYPDQPLSEQQAQSDGLHSILQQKWAVVPQQAGTIELPEIQVPWFNVLTGRAEVAILPAETLTVLPPVASTNGGIAAAERLPELALDQRVDTGLETSVDPGVSGNNSDTRSVESPDGVAVVNANWRLTAVVALIGWLVTVVILFRLLWSRLAHRSRRRSAAERVDAEAFAGLRAACASGDPRLVARAVAVWARQHALPGTLLGLAMHLDPSPVADDLRALDQALYAGRTCPVDLSTLSDRLRQMVDEQAQHKPSSTAGGLPAL